MCRIFFHRCESSVSVNTHSRTNHELFYTHALGNILSLKWLFNTSNITAADVFSRTKNISQQILNSPSQIKQNIFIEACIFNIHAQVLSNMSNVQLTLTT